MVAIKIQEYERSRLRLRRITYGHRPNFRGELEERIVLKPNVKDLLKLSHRHLPQYLIRVSSTASGGGNSASRFTSVALHASEEREDFSRFSDEYIGDMIHAHLLGEKRFKSSLLGTRLISLTSSWRFAMPFARNLIRQGNKDTMITVVDRSKLVNPPIFLRAAYAIKAYDINNQRARAYAHYEYFAWDELNFEGAGTQITAETLVNKTLYQHLPDFRPGSRIWESEIKLLGNGTDHDLTRRKHAIRRSISLDQVEDLRRFVYNAFRKKSQQYLILPVTVALLCLQLRHFHLDSIVEEVVKSFQTNPTLPDLVMFFTEPSETNMIELTNFQMAMHKICEELAIPRDYWSDRKPPNIPSHLLAPEYSSPPKPRMATDTLGLNALREGRDLPEFQFCRTRTRDLRLVWFRDVARYSEWVDFLRYLEQQNIPLNEYNGRALRVYYRYLNR